MSLSSFCCGFDLFFRYLVFMLLLKKWRGNHEGTGKTMRNISLFSVSTHLNHVLMVTGSDLASVQVAKVANHCDKQGTAQDHQNC